MALRGCETGCLEAGQPVLLDFQPRDALGNAVCCLQILYTNPCRLKTCADVQPSVGCVLQTAWLDGAAGVLAPRRARQRGAEAQARLPEIAAS